MAVTIVMHPSPRREFDIEVRDDDRVRLSIRDGDDFADLYLTIDQAQTLHHLLGQTVYPF